MAKFSISAYNSDGRCKICWSLASEHHHEGCELGATYSEILKMRLIIGQFLKLLGVETVTSAFSKVAVLMREDDIADKLLSKALGHLSTSSEEGAKKLHDEIAEAFGMSEKDDKQ